MVQSRAFAVPSREAVVDIDQILRHAERLESRLLGGEVLLVGGETRAYPTKCGDMDCVAFAPPSPGISAGGACANLQAAEIIEFS
ncbi:hypothetical protein GCM10023166_00040 [Paeniglutamicibacter cryotolerans]